MNLLGIALSTVAIATAFACAATDPKVTMPKTPAHSAEELLTAIRASDADRVGAILADDPDLAAAHTPKGTSAIVVAAFTRSPDQETFIKPSNNAMLHALLARKPPMDVHDAAIAGDTARLGSLLAGDPALANAPHAAFGAMPLHFAAFADRTDAIEMLLAKGAALDAEAKNKFHNTPLVVAMLGDAVNAATLLLSRGANVEIPEDGGFRALHIAAESGDVRLVELLLDHHAQIDARSDDGTTPLGVANKKGRKAIADVLVSRGAT